MTLEQKLSRVARQTLGLDNFKSQQTKEVTAAQVYAALLSAYQVGYRDRCKNDTVSILDSMG